MKISLRVSNISNHRLHLTWVEPQQTLEAGEEIVVPLEDSNLYRKGHKGEDARNRLESQLDKGQIVVAVIGDIPSVFELPEYEKKAVNMSLPNSTVATEDQKRVMEAVTMSEEMNKSFERFKFIKTDDAESSDKLAATPGTAISEDPNVVDLSNGSVRDAAEALEQREKARDEQGAAYEKYQKSQDPVKKAASDKKAYASSSGPLKTSKGSGSSVSKSSKKKSTAKTPTKSTAKSPTKSKSKSKVSGVTSGNS